MGIRCYDVHMNKPKPDQNNLITLKVWKETHKNLVALTAHFIQRDHRGWSLVEALEHQLKKVHDLYHTEGDGYTLPVVKPTGDRNQTTIRVSQMAYDHLLMIQARVMLDTLSSIRLFQVVHSVVMSGLAEFD